MSSTVISSSSPTPTCSSAPVLSVIHPANNGNNSNSFNTIEAMDKECSALGGLFQIVVNEMKNGVPHYEEFANKASKLHAQLRSTILVLSSFLDTFQKIADAASNTKGATRDIGSCLTRIVIRHRAMESRMKSLCGALMESLVSPIQDKVEDWKKNVLQLDKDHSKEYKKLRADLKKRSEHAARAQKKCGKKSGKNIAEAQRQSEIANNELNKHYKGLVETEKGAVRKALVEERSRYCMFVNCIRPILDEEVGLVSEFQQLEEVSKKLTRHTEEPHKLPPASERVINDISANSSDSNFTFKTPPSSPSSLGSRRSSMCSVSSASSNSSLHQTNNQQSPLHHPGSGMVPGGATLRQHHRSQLQQQQHQQQLQGSGQPGAMMRLSSISSQDSGFTSQDTLFLRPNSPSNRLKDNDLASLSNMSESVNERPHTISTAYEKGGQHQRPSLQPYTFQPPPEQQQDTEFKKPPVPQRCVSLEKSSAGLPVKPALPSGKKPSLPVATNNSNSWVPSFDSNKEDMVLPQPVYMNMSDLASMAAQKAQSFQQSHPTIHEEEPDLKTPTVEELSVVPNAQKVLGVNGDGSSSTSESSVGSSSGYGSQSTVRLEEQQQLQQQQQQQQQKSLTEGDMPRPAPLLDSSKYRSLPRQHSQQHYHQIHQEQHNNFVHNFNNPSNNSHHFQSRTLQHRPYSFTQGVIPEASELELGVGMTGHNMSTLRRANSSANATMKPQQLRQAPMNSFDMLRDDRSPPPPPAPQAHIAPTQQQQQQQQQQNSMGSNSSTPRGSMEHLPPPPPHLLHPEEEVENAPEHQALIAQRGVSVAESIKALQRTGHMPCSPKSLRRAHSVTGAHSPFVQQHTSSQQQQQHQETIYAPVAHLQQKLQQRQQIMANNMAGNQRSPEGEQYGFGVQFKQHQTQFYQHNQVSGAMSTSHDQIMGQVDANMRNRPRPPPMLNQSPQSQQQQQQSFMGNQEFNSSYDAQTAMRVRNWIESRSVGDVRNVRPFLNAEIHQGLALRKTSSRNDRSAPRF